jgi:iron(III) transport system ATP-binding protein
MWLEVAAITRQFGTRAAVQDLSFQLDRGSIGCLLGPSGCGKTTALRCIAGFESIDSGVIRAQGRVLCDSRFSMPPEKRQIGMVFQDYALFPHLTVEENVAFGLHRLAAAQRANRASELLSLVGLADRRKHFPHQLSGGEQQRVALARALAPEPEIVLLDEPFSSLDVELRERLSLEVRSVLKHLGTTALLVTHDQQEAFAMADVVGVMREGRLEQWDKPYELYHRPTTRFVADFIGQGVFISGDVLDGNAVQTELGVVRMNGSTWRPGQHVDLLLRPDDVIHDDASELKVEISARAFRGAEFLYTLKLPSGAALLSLVPSHHDHAVGECIGIRIEPDHVVAFERRSDEVMR